MNHHATAGEAAERLLGELAKRLDDPALADDLEALLMGEVVRRICRDLGQVAAALPWLAQREDTGRVPMPRRIGSG